MAEWITTTLEECTDILGDGLHGTPKYTENGEYAFVNGNNLVDGEILIKKETKRVDYSQYDKYKKPLTNRTILVSINGTLGNVGVYGSEKIILGKSACYFNVKESVDKDFIYYIVSSPTFKQYLESNATGTTIKNISLKQMREYTFELPEIGEQKRISSVLRKIDEKIKNNRAINNNLKQQYISIVDNLLSKLTQYKIYSLLEVADCQNGRAFYKEGYDPNGAFVIDLGNVNTSGNFVRTAADKYISLDRYKEPKLEKYRVYKNDIVMVMTDRKSTMELLGKVGKIYKDGYYLLNQRMYRIRAKKGINTNYLYACLNSTETSNFLKRKALGSVQKYVNTGEINSIEIKVPSSEKMEEIASILDPIFSQMESNILENESLNELRDILLPKLMSGEIDVSDIDL